MTSPAPRLSGADAAAAVLDDRDASDAPATTERPRTLVLNLAQPGYGLHQVDWDRNSSDASDEEKQEEAQDETPHPDAGAAKRAKTSAGVAVPQTPAGAAVFEPLAGADNAGPAPERPARHRHALIGELSQEILGVDTQTSELLQSLMSIFSNVARNRDPADPRAATHFEFQMQGPGGFASGSSQL